MAQGIDARKNWDRYFRFESVAANQRTVRATIAWIRDKFAAAAKREGRFGTARLLRINATRNADLLIRKIDDACRRGIAEGLPLGVWQRRQAIANACQFPASARAACIPCVVFDVSSGLHIH